MAGVAIAGALGTPAELHSSGRGPTVVLLHPLGANRSYWDGVAALLPNRNVVTYDLPGHGDRRGVVGPYGITDLAQELADALLRADVGPVHLVGNSIGGLVAQVFAAQFGSRLVSLTLVDTVARYPQAARVQWALRARTARELGLEPIVEPTMATWFTPAELDGDSAIVDAMSSTLAATSVEGYARACEALARADVRACVPRITAPTLVVCGTDDLPHFVDAVPYFTETLPDARALWLPGRHAAVLQEPARFAAALLEHTAATAPPAATQ